MSDIYARQRQKIREALTAAQLKGDQTGEQVIRLADMIVDLTERVEALEERMNEHAH